MMLQHFGHISTPFNYFLALTLPVAAAPLLYTGQSLEQDEEQKKWTKYLVN